MAFLLAQARRIVTDWVTQNMISSSGVYTKEI